MTSHKRASLASLNSIVTPTIHHHQRIHVANNICFQHHLFQAPYATDKQSHRWNLEKLLRVGAAPADIRVATITNSISRTLPAIIRHRVPVQVARRRLVTTTSLMSVSDWMPFVCTQRLVYCPPLPRIRLMQQIAARGDLGASSQQPAATRACCTAQAPHLSHRIPVGGGCREAVYVGACSRSCQSYIPATK